MAFTLSQFLQLATNPEVGNAKAVIKGMVSCGATCRKTWRTGYFCDFFAKNAGCRFEIHAAVG